MVGHGDLAFLVLIFHSAVHTVHRYQNSTYSTQVSKQYIQYTGIKTVHTVHRYQKSTQQYTGSKTEHNNTQVSKQYTTVHR